MGTLSILSPSHTFTRLLSIKTSPHPLLHHLTQTLGFCCPKAPSTHSPNLLRFRVTFQSPSSAFPAKSQLSDAEEDEEEDEFEEDDDEDVAADEYDDISGDASDGLEQSDDEIEMDASMVDAEPSIRDEEFKWQRVEKLCNDVKQFGEEMIDDGALASIYDFRIDKS